MKECAFCPNNANDGEHYWSAWIGDLFKTSGYNFRRLNTATGSRLAWRRPSLGEKTKVVCKTCNNTWMSNLENESKAAFAGMIRDGTEISVLSRGASLLAAFAFKCAVVADHAEPHEGPFFSRFARRRFRESRQIPPGVRMWLAAFHDPVGRRGLYTNYSTSPTLEQFSDLKFYVFTFLAGHLAFQLHATKWTKLHKQGTPIPVVEPKADWDARVAAQFWPNVGSPIAWPPPLYLDGDALQQFTYRWTGSARIMI